MCVLIFDCRLLSLCLSATLLRSPLSSNVRLILYPLLSLVLGMGVSVVPLLQLLDTFATLLLSQVVTSNLKLYAQPPRLLDGRA